MTATQPQMAGIDSVRLHDGRSLCVRSWSGPGDPVVMLHGLHDSSECWTDVAERLPCARIAVDMPGFGSAEGVSVPGVRMLAQAAMPSALSSRLAVSAAYVAMVTNGAKPEPAVVERVTRRGPALVAGAREGTGAIVDAGRSRYACQRRGLAYDGPVFAIWGDRDRLVPLAHPDGVRVALPQARIEVWRGMCHHPVKERSTG